jgi:CBS domain-containing protein
MKNDPISTLMQRRTVTISADQTVQAAEAYLTEQDLSWAPVTGDRGELVGVISDADLRRFNAGGGDPSTPVWRQCTYRPITVGPETTVAAVAKLMVERHIHHVVVTVNGGIGGVVSSLDMVKLLL